jgi:putative phage-type endonuclease
MKRVDLKQGSPDWHLWRTYGIGGSDVAAILGLSPWQTREALLNHKATHDPRFDRKKSDRKTPAMQHGIDSEPRVRAMYEDLIGIKVTPCCILHDEWDWHKASLDGLNDLEDLIVEIKSPTSPRSHRPAVAGIVPEHYYCQIQHQLSVAGIKRCHYVSWCEHPDFSPSDQLRVVPVTRSDTYIRHLLEEEVKFMEDLRNLLKLQGKKIPEKFCRPDLTSLAGML